MAANLPVRARLRTPDGRILKLRQQHLQSARLYRDPDGKGWVASVKRKGVEQFTGPDAERAAAVLLPAINYMAGSRAAVRAAVASIEDAGDPEAYLARVSNPRCRMAGAAYASRFQKVLELIERDGYQLRPAYPERKSLGSGLRMLWTGLAAAAGWQPGPDLPAPLSDQARERQ